MNYYSFFALFFSFLEGFILPLRPMFHRPMLQVFDFVCHDKFCLFFLLLCAIFGTIKVSYTLFPHVCRAFTILFWMFGAFSIILIIRAVLIFVPIFINRISESMVLFLVTFDEGVEQIAMYKRQSPLSSPMEADGYVINHYNMYTFILIIVLGCIATWAWLSVARRPSHGAITRDHTRCDTAFPPKIEQPTTPLCAPTTTESLQTLLQTLLQFSTTTTPSPPPTPSTQIIQQHLDQFKSEILAILHQEFATLSSTLALAIPSMTAISQITQDAVARTIVPKNQADTKIIANREYPKALNNPSDSDEEMPNVNVAGAWKTVQKKVQKSLKPKVMPTESLTPIKVDGRSPEELSIDELRAVLRQKTSEKSAARQQEIAATMYLTEDEQQLTLDELHRKWKVEAQQTRSERPKLNRFDWEGLGTLTEEQKLLPRHEIRKIIKNRKYDRWVASMKAQGIPLHQCDICQELATENHRCLATRWTTEGQRGVRKGLVITQTGRGAIRLHEKQIIDQTALNKEYEEIAKLKREVEDRMNRIKGALASDPSTDVEMINPTTIIEPESPSTPALPPTPPSEFPPTTSYITSRV
jgi:hypothetical protein